MVSLLHLAQFLHPIFEECHSELCGVFGTVHVFLGIAFSLMKLVSFSNTSTKRGKALSGHIEKNCFCFNHLAGGDCS